MTQVIEVKIDSIGAGGDGLAELDGKPLYVPFTVPGDVVRVARPVSGNRDRGRLLELLSPGPDRVAPACRHFGSCGGCALQHLRPAAHGRWKQQLARTALTRRGLGDVTVEAPILVAPGSRRRVTLRYRGGKDRASLGFNERGSNRIVDIAECPVAVKRIVALLPPLKALLARIMLPGAPAELALCATETGIDMVINTRGEADLARRERLAAFARVQDLARVSWLASGTREPETIIERRAPIIHFGAIPVSPPAGAFLQASGEGETALRELALAAIGDNTRRGLDLFAGCGSFALPAALGCAMHAVDSEPSMLAALQAAGRHAPGLKALTTEARDLFRRPVRTEELKSYDLVIVDPPRAGARAQAEQIALSGVPTVIAASCNPATFARDARILVDGGYRLDKVTPVDQFPWSAQIELLAVFRRA